ncbi:MAG: hypothetical protein AMXMBFR80_14480 [Dehalococcoidia bacterium]|jgi:predicted lipid-binding transport protein (Tim44 family)|nr:hypothetical protein [Tepidiformaceae bacterium]
MSARKRRGRQPATVAPAAQGAAPAPAPRTTPMPDWKWRTFPVFFAFALGGFAGLYMGIVSAESSGFFVFASAFWAVLLGLGLSRFTTRWIMSRQWARRRSAAKQPRR